MSKIRAFGWLLVGAALCVAAAAQDGAPAQSGPSQPGAAQSAPPPAAKPAGPASQSGASAGAASKKGDSDSAAASGDGQHDVVKDGEFIPSEELSPDEDVTFPVDI